jgi:CheY-like chemotaxis protein/HPt (histidine-containing phosphotransfer) domain-containing protein
VRSTGGPFRHAPRARTLAASRTPSAVTEADSCPDSQRARSARPVLRVLVVDDDPLSRSFQTHLLALLGHEASALADPELAVARALEGGFDVLLLDLGMPGADGFEVMRRLREREAREQRPPLAVLAVTGFVSRLDRARCLAAGFSEHLAKPIQVDALSAALAHALGARGCGAVESSDATRLRATIRRLHQSQTPQTGFAPTVTESFALRSAQLLETLRRCVQQRDAQALARAAQALRGSAEYLGALRLVGMCSALQQSAVGDDWGGAEAALGTIADEHQAVLALLLESSRS